MRHLFLLAAAAAMPGTCSAAALLPHTEQIAPGVFATGFADRYGSANSGWVVSRDQTLLIDLPRGVAIADYLAEVKRIGGKPVRSIILTHVDSGDEAALAELDRQGISRVGTAPGVQYIAYDNVFGRSTGAVSLASQKILFGGPAVVNGPRPRLPGSDSALWVEALDRLGKLGATTVVPGYGSWGPGSMIRRQRRLLTEMRRQVAYGITMGKPAETIAKEVLLPASYYAWMPYDNPNGADIRHIYGEMTAPAAPYHGKPPEVSDAKPHALVLIGDRYHEPEHIEEGLAPVFEKTGVTPHFTVDVKTLTAANLAHVKLLVILRDGMLWPEGPSRPYTIWMTPEQEKAVVDFVEGGGAFLNLHNSMGLYPKDGPYLNLVGGRYIGHGPLERFTVEVVDRDHPITRGVSPFWSADEQHTPPCDSKVHVLLENRSDEGKTAAAGWAYEPGKGRLCHLAPGHTREALGHPMFQKLMVNAVEWLLRR